MAVMHEHLAADRLRALRENAEQRCAAAEHLVAKLTDAVADAPAGGRARLHRQIDAARAQAAEAAVEAEGYARRAAALRSEPGA